MVSFSNFSNDLDIYKHCHIELIFITPNIDCKRSPKCNLYFQGFTLEFYFEANEFFTNTVLTKEYIMRSEPDETEPFGFEGPEIIKCKG